jgi:hypothetical protein
MEITRTADQDTTTWTAVIDGTEVAWLAVWTANREICSVDTLAAHQREGIASALYRHADAEVGIYHTIPAHRSAEGDAFAAAVGGDTSDNALVIDCCCCDHCAI